jgi:hypothetical protein
MIDEGRLKIVHNYTSKESILRGKPSRHYKRGF